MIPHLIPTHKEPDGTLWVRADDAQKAIKDARERRAFHIMDLHAEIRRLQKLLTIMATGLEHFGAHRDGCSNIPCSCGLTGLVRTADSQEKKGRPWAI